MLTPAASVKRPPAPELPWSSTGTCSEPAPAKSAGARHVMPSRAALTSARVPVKVMDASSLPSPVEEGQASGGPQAHEPADAVDA